MSNPETEFNTWVLGVIAPVNDRLSLACCQVHDAIYCARHIADAQGIKDDALVVRIAEMVHNTYLDNIDTDDGQGRELVEKSLKFLREVEEQARGATK